MTAPTDIEHARFNMIEQQIRPWDVLDLRILDLLTYVRREDYVPTAYRDLAFVDTEIPLDDTGERAAATGRCMLAPRVEARMVQDVNVQPSDRVLEIGAGSGHVAALLAHGAREVVTMEIDPVFARMADANLRRNGVANARVIDADGSQGLANEGPWDVIVLSGSTAEVPRVLVEQLAPGGRLIGITGDAPIMRATLVRRAVGGGIETTQPWDTFAGRLLNFHEPKRFRF